MKICMVHSEPKRLPRIQLEQKSLRKAGHDAYILEPLAESKFEPRVASAAVRYFTLMMQEFMQRPDAYHVMNIPDVLGLVPILKKNGFVYDVRSPWAEELRALGYERVARTAEQLERYLTRKADIVIVVNRVLERRAVRWGASRVYVLPNYPPKSFAPTVSPEAFRSELGLSDKSIMLYVGKFSAVECTMDLVRMIEKIVELVPDAVLVMIGDGPERPEIESYIRRRKLGDRVIIAGWVPHEDVPNWISIADVCLLPRREDMPSARFYSPHSVRKVGEYLSLGKTVVATPVGEFAETELPIIVAPLAEFPRAISEAVDRPSGHAEVAGFTWEGTEAVLWEAYDELERLI